MSSNQVAVLLGKLIAAGLDCKPTSSDEIAICCPRCFPQHSNRRKTLYVNAITGSFICHRCQPKFAFKGGHGEKRNLALGYLLDGLGLNGIKNRIIDSQPDNTLSLKELRAKLLPSDLAVAIAKQSGVMLPEGFRTDWKACATGLLARKYLLARGLSRDVIKSCGVGYIAGTDLHGSVVFPVYMDGELRFWQARRFMFSSGYKYMSCPGVEKRTVLYGYDGLTRVGEAVIVEGIFDALKVGRGAVALLGKTISEWRIALLAR